MKRVIISILLLLVVFASKAQLRYTGQWAINASGCMTLDKGFGGYLGVEKYFSNSIGSLAFGIDYTRDQKFIKITDFGISTTSLSVLYFYSLENFIKAPYFINIGAGATVGVENFEKKKLPEGVIQYSGAKLTYGFSVKPQFEYLVSKKISLFVVPEIHFALETRFDKFKFKPSFGIKCYL